MPSYLNKVSGNVTANNDAVTVTFRHFANGGVGIFVDDLTNWTGTITFEATRDATSWFSVNATNDTTLATGTTTTVKGPFYVNVVGIVAARARLSTVGGNTAKITLIANPG